MKWKSFETAGFLFGQTKSSDSLGACTGITVAFVPRHPRAARGEAPALNPDPTDPTDQTHSLHHI